VLDDSIIESDAPTTYETTITPTPATIDITLTPLNLIETILCQTVNVDEIEVEKAIIFPNPASENISINLGNQTNLNNISIQILNCNGEIIYDEENADPNNFRMNVSLWPAGIYLLKLESENQIAPAIYSSNLFNVFH
ncbi:MAG: T9SS type A sorting domain-containing protein, partial [Chitinophagales bacterium]